MTNGEILMNIVKFLEKGAEAISKEHADKLRPVLGDEECYASLMAVLVMYYASCPNVFTQTQLQTVDCYMHFPKGILEEIGATGDVNMQRHNAGNN